MRCSTTSRIFQYSKIPIPLSVMSLSGSPRSSTTPCWPRPASTTTPATTTSSAPPAGSTSPSAPSPSPTRETLTSSGPCQMPNSSSLKTPKRDGINNKLGTETMALATAAGSVFFLFVGISSGCPISRISFVPPRVIYISFRRNGGGGGTSISKHKLQ